MTAQKLYRGADAAFPGAALPAGTTVLAAYVGIAGKGSASPDTPHIWSKSDWNGYVEKDPQLRLLPIYVHNYDDGQPVRDAMNAVDSVEALGWTKGAKGDAERIIAVDCETLQDYRYFEEMGNTIYANGYRVVTYGSSSTIRSNPRFAGYWIADYNYSHAPTTIPSGAVGLQWKPGGAWDLNLFSQALVDGTGVGLRH
jgi:hypothetical protein